MYGITGLVPVVTNMAFGCQELLRSILDPETTHTLYDGQWMMVVDDGDE